MVTWIPENALKELVFGFYIFFYITLHFSTPFNPCYLLANLYINFYITYTKKHVLHNKKGQEMIKNDNKGEGKEKTVIMRLSGIMTVDHN